jgi:sugar phosphate permease
MFVVNFFLGLDALPYYFVIFFVGFFLGGPYNIISAAVSIDLAKQPALSGQKKAIATVSSLIEGTGSFGAAILQTVIGSIDSKYIFYLFTILCFTASICLIPIVIQDVKDLLERHHRKHD